MLYLYFDCLVQFKAVFWGSLLQRFRVKVSPFKVQGCSALGFSAPQGDVWDGECLDGKH